MFLFRIAAISATEDAAIDGVEQVPEWKYFHVWSTQIQVPERIFNNVQLIWEQKLRRCYNLIDESLIFAWCRQI